MFKSSLAPGAAAAVVVAALLAVAGTASANPISMPNYVKEAQHDQAAGALVPPAPPCPQNVIGQSCSLVPETPALGVPYPGNMAYYGGHVQVHPKEYLVYWGWGQSGAWPSGTKCASEQISEGTPKASLSCDPDGAGRYMANFLKQAGGTHWAGVSTQFYETDSSGKQTFIANDRNLLAGIWVDNADPNTLPKTNLDIAAGSTNTLTVLGREAQAAVKHFKITDLTNSDIVIAQPPGLSDPNALSQGYCAFHDYTWPGVETGDYDGLTKGIVFSNIPYQLAINSSGSNVCGENAVNSDSQGKLDGFSIVLGHEMEEAITDPGAEDVVGTGISPTHLGGWYDTVDANENGDKCAWVGLDPATGQGTFPIPGALGNITGSGGGRFAVQSLWSDAAAAGLGWCAGVNDLPGS